MIRPVEELYAEATTLAAAALLADAGYALIPVRRCAPCGQDKPVGHLCIGIEARLTADLLAAVSNTHRDEGAH